MRKLLLMPLALATFTACELTPTHVEPSDIDDAMARELYKTVCKGLEMKDPDTRKYASSKLDEIDEPLSAECMCEYAWSAEKHTWDDAILNGLEGSERDDLVACFLPALEDPSIDKRLELVTALTKTRASSIPGRMTTLATDTSEPSDIRSQAISSFGGTPDADTVKMLVGLLQNEGDTTVRAAAAAALVGQNDEVTVAALVDAVSNDADGEVRAAALKTVRGLRLPESDEMICKAMLEDESPAVRKQAIMSYKGTKRDEAVACLRKKAFQEETDGDVRSALLTVLKSSPNKNAPAILCDAIPFYMKTYITDNSPEKVPGTDIAAAQNDRDWENSYDCFGKALNNKSGWSCKGKQYVAAWYREVGGKPHVPRCQGDEGFGEVVFQ
jgi:hypothetical protein